MKTDTTRINPNSSIRSGYDFEDLYVLQLCVKWLKNPRRYSELKIQYVPSEIKAFRFAIDDIVAKDQNGFLEFHQLKHLQNPSTDLWTFDRLLEKGWNNWISSYASLINAGIPGTGALITNGTADSEVADCLQEDRINYEKLVRHQPKLLQSLNVIHGEDALRQFCDNFVFTFDMPGRDKLEGELREILYYELKVTQAGADRLLLHIGQQGSAKYPLVFTLSSIRDQLSWDDPRPLNQDFEVPADFEFFDKHKHALTVQELRDTCGGIKLFTGKPGSGKSTYLSKLYQLLQEKVGLFVIRHHYHLNPKDTSYRDRLNSDRVKEALKAEFKKQKEDVLGQLAIHNTEHTPLKDFIAAVAKYYSDRGKTFVLIIDGLDHVIRESFDERELGEFIEQVLYPQKGFWLVLGTQEMALPFLPNVISRLVLPEKRIEIKGLSRQAVRHIFEKHPVRACVHQHEDIADQLIPALYAKTQGNPLHLKYVLKQLELGNDVVSADSIAAVLPYTGEISDYYSALWQQLAPLSKTFALAITRLDFKLQEEQLFDLAAHLASKPQEISEAYKQIRHLIRIELPGISVYHNSFAVFIGDQPELAEQQMLLYKQLRNWLKKPKNKDLAWAELLKVEYALGNDKPLLKVDKPWIINAYLDCRDEIQIIRILELAVEAAFKKRLYSKVLEFRYLEVYFENKQYNLSKVLPALGDFAYSRKKKGSKRFLDYGQLSHFALKNYLLNLYDEGILQAVPSEALLRFDDLLRTHDYEQDEVIESIFEVLLHFNNEPFKKIYTFLLQFKGTNRSVAYFNLFIQLLLRMKREELIGQLLKQTLQTEERNVVYQRLLVHHLLTGKRDWVPEIDIWCRKAQPDQFSELYYFFKERTTPKHIRLDAAKAFPDALDYQSARSGKANELYTGNFFSGLYLCLSGSAETVRKWIAQPVDHWPVLLMKTVLKNSLRMADDYQSKHAFRIAELISSFQSLPDLDFYANHEIFELKRTIIPHLFATLFRTGAILNAQLNILNELSKDDVIALFDCKWLNDTTRHELFDSSSFGFSDVAYDAYQNRVIAGLESTIVQFDQRAERYVALIRQAERLGRQAEADALLTKAADILISYGNHKDMTLAYVIENIQVCGTAGSKKTKDYLRQIAPYVYDMEAYTDGDETGAFIYTWAGLLSIYDPNLLFNLYFDALEKRNYGLSESLFGDCLACLDLGEPIGAAIAETAVSHSAHNSLSFLAKTSPEAQRALGKIDAMFGPVNYDDEREPQQDYGSHTHEVDISKITGISSTELIGYYDNLGHENYSRKNYVQQNFLKEWCTVWLPENEEGTFDVITALKTLTVRDFTHIPAEVLDLLYPHVLASDPKFAFDCLCWSYANNSDWSDLSTHLESAKQKWKLLIRDFPARVLDFLDKTIIYSGRNRGKGGTYYLPVPRVTHFFSYVGMTDRAEELTSANIALLPNLFPGVKLNQPAFALNEEQILPIDVLLKRVEWLSPLTRERAAYLLAEMLADDTAGVLHTRFIKWLLEVKLETYACYGLTIVLKSLDRPGSASYMYINFDKTYPIGLRCMATDLFLQAIAKKTRTKFFAPIPRVIVLSSRRDEMMEEKFFSNMDAYLTQFYHETIIELQRKARVPVWRLWYYLFIEKIEALGIEETWDDPRYANTAGELMIGRSNVISEIFKSSFFNLLDYLYDAKLISYYEFDSNTKKNLPADISFWRIKPGKVPDWWPTFKKGQAGDLRNLLEVPIRSLIAANDKDQLLSLKGAVRTGINYFVSKRQGELILLPFAYRLKGNRMPEAEIIFEALSRARSCWISKAESPQDLGFFDHELMHSGQGLTAHQLLDLEVTDLVGTIILDTGMIWQYYRMVHQPALLNPILQGSLNLSTDGDQITYTDGKTVICTVNDFALGMRETIEQGDIIPSGNYLKIDRAYLQNKLDENQLKLGYVCRLNVREKGSSYRTIAKTHSLYEMIFI
ncbi:ATP-binding protein [Pedobacter sp. L105]|uniref:ATP-binding protein n=1 Tax=Pedobacter sp. L105 TaxID=1641871 RepID=UPI00131BF6B3|nr:ATP-binding protein [Pedobacter sp. L105]